MFVASQLIEQKRILKKHLTSHQLNLRLDMFTPNCNNLEKYHQISLSGPWSATYHLG